MTVSFDAEIPAAHPPRAGGMRWLATARSVATGLFVALLPVLLVTSVVRVLVSDAGFYRRGLREHGAEERTGFALAELDRAADQIVRYFEDDADSLRITVLVNGNEEPLFAEHEIEHMRDVKGLIRVLFTVNQVALVFVIAYVGGVFLWARENGLRRLAWEALGGVAVGLAVVAGIGAFALTGFDAAWTRFHEVAFSNDLWRLDPDTDRLIQMFPEPFWEEATLIAGAGSAAAALAVALVAGSYLLLVRPGRGDVPRA